VNNYAKFRLPGALLLTGGALLACETAAQTIAATPGHQTIVGSLYNPLDGLKWLKELNGRCVVGPWFAHVMNPAHLKTGMHAQVCTTSTSVIRQIDQRVALLFAGGLVPFVGLRLVEGRAKAKKADGRVFAPVRTLDGAPAQLVVEIGTATGKLRELGHEAGIKKGQRVCLVGDDVSQDTLILGGKGAGKTTAGVNPILLQALRQGCGALVFNVKGDFDRTVSALARKAGRKVRIIGVGQGAERFDLLAGVSPEMAATYVSALLLLSGNRAAEATFWNTGASNLARAVLGVLWYFPAHYSLPGLYRYLFIAEYRKHITDELVADLYCRLGDVAEKATGARRAVIERDMRYLDGCLQEITAFFDVKSTTHEIRSGIQSQLSQILAKMVVPEVEDAFGTPQDADAVPIALEDLLDGAVFVVNVPLQTYGLAAAAIMTFLKLRFFTMMEQRRLRKDCNQTRRVGLIIDEYHEVATCSQEGMSDHKALSLSRDTGAFCVFSTQSVYSLISKVGDDMTRALLANLRQRIIFRTEDRWTIEDALYLLGQTEVDRETTSATKQPGAWFSSKGTSHAPQLQALANASLIRYLKQNEALAIMSIGGESADDIITLAPEYA